MGRDVETTLNYYADPGDGSEPTPVVVGQGTVTNERKMAETAVTVRDITGREDEFNLDNVGFQLITRPTDSTACVADKFRDVGLIKSDYYDECADVLKEATGASRVHIFDHKVRHGPIDWHNRGPGNVSQRGPLHRVHVDQSYNGAEFLLKWTLPDEAELLSKGRWQIINVWRPLHEVTKHPLAVVDHMSIADSDLVEARVIYPDHTQPTWTVKASPTNSHKWYYKHRHTPDQVMLIKCYDSIDDGSVARCVPHSAFHDKEYEDDKPRVSIEVRALVFYGA